MLVNIGAVIRQRRKQLKITQPHLAELAGVNANTVYKLERNETNATLKVLSKIADVLGMEVKLEIKKLD